MPTNTETIQIILEKDFPESQIQVSNDSHLHAGHPEAIRSGGGHFSVQLISKHFAGLSLIKRHRLIYQSLAPLKDSIHALAIKALTPDE